MSVTIDHEPLAAHQLGLHTVGHVLCHIQKTNRFVTQLLIDGEEPPVSELSNVRQTALDGHVLFIETADPRDLALQVLDEASAQVQATIPLQPEAADLFQGNQPGKALEKLGACIRAWQNAEESIQKITELLRINPNDLAVNGSTLRQVFLDFAASLRSIRSALEQRDFVSLSDILLYEINDHPQRWLSALSTVRDAITSLR